MANILIVDDSLTIAKFVETLLLNAGHTVSISVDATEAIRRLSLVKYDLILLDVVMPGKNGFQLCREIKMHPQHAKTPVIIMSTKNTDIDKYWGRKQGADEYLVKPVDADILLAAVNRFAPTTPRPQPQQMTAAPLQPPVAVEVRPQPPISGSAPVPSPAPVQAASSLPTVEEKKTSTARSFFSRFGFR